MTTRPSDPIETCVGCGVGLIKRKEWNALGPEGRDRVREWGFDRKERAGCCQKCGQSNYGHNARRRSENEQAVRAARLEDVLWMGECGESLAGAAARVGITEGALDKFLRREGQDELLMRMILRNPRDPNGVNTLSYQSRIERRKRVA